MLKTKQRSRRTTRKKIAIPKPRRRSTAKKTESGGGNRYDAVTAGITFVVGATFATFLFFANPVLAPFETYNLVNCGVLLWIPLTIMLLFFRQEPSRFGLSAGDKKFGLRFTLLAIVVMLPLVLAAAQMSSFRTYYDGRLMNNLGPTPPVLSYDITHPIYNAIHRVTGYPIQFHSLSLVYYELAMGCYMFCWEFFFRGFLLFGLARAKFLGNVGAVLAQTIPFTLLHWSLDPHAAKPIPEIIGAFFGGLALGALAIRTRSFFYGFLIHWAISAALDFFVIAPQLMKL